MQYQLILMPMIGAIIGWGTNILAIRLVFRPLKPIKIPLLGLEVQGLIPKRRQEIASSIGETLEGDILSPEEIIDNLANDESKNNMLKTIRKVVEEKATSKLPAFIPSALKNIISDHLGEMVNQHGGQIFDELKDNLSQKAKDQLDLKGLVEDKINSFDIEELERIIIDLSKRELKQIEVLGGVLGFLIGLLQAAFSFLLT